MSASGLATIRSRFLLEWRQNKAEFLCVDNWKQICYFCVVQKGRDKRREESWKRGISLFTVTREDISSILEDFDIASKVIGLTELERYHYEKEDPQSKEVRLIIKADLDNGQSVVIRFKHEADVTLDIITAQSRFANLLADRGIETPRIYMTGGQYARWYSIKGYDVIVTVEAFTVGELHEVNADIAKETGRLLAQMHNIAEAADSHVPNDVLFDPLCRNDLFCFQDFEMRKDFLLPLDETLYKDIVREYDGVFQRIRRFENAPRYAVQGDISICNLYQTVDGRIGVFDFNRCGDNILYYDAVMQAIFEARLMDYPQEIAGKQEDLILSSFLRGYHQERPFTNEQKECFPYLYAIISAFWLGDIKWGEGSLCHAIEAGDTEAAHQWMREIQRRILFRPEMPL